MSHTLSVLRLPEEANLRCSHLLSVVRRNISPLWEGPQQTPLEQYRLAPMGTQVYESLFTLKHADGRYSVSRLVCQESPSVRQQSEGLSGGGSPTPVIR